MSLINQPGFLGTHAGFVSDLSLVLILLSSILFTIGWQLARHKRFTAHRWIQTIAFLLNLTVVILVMIRSYILHILPGLAANFLKGDYEVTTIHAFIGAVGVLFGLYTILQGHKLLPKNMRLKKPKTFMRITYSIYMAATVLGIVVYLMVYVLGI